MRKFVIITIAALTLMSGTVDQTAYARKAKKKATATATTKSRSSAKSGKKKETAADVRRRQEATQKEIRLTQQQIKENDIAVKKSLNELGKLEGDINESKRKVAEAGSKVNALQKQITGLQAQIADGEKSLAGLRAEYLKAVRKMRARRREKSMLAFIFSSESFNEAMRRMRYLKQFSEWRERQTKEISAKVTLLKKQSEQLAQTKTMHDRALASQVKARNDLQAQYVRQDAIVVELKKNGQALNSHLAKKQAEVNVLKGRVAALIAEEQRKAEAERKAHEQAEAERVAREKAEAERLAREERERERLIAENAAKEKEEKETPAGSSEKRENVRKKENPVKKKDTPRKEAESKPSVTKKRQPAPKPKQSGTKKKENEVTYADARRRRPKSAKSSPSATAGKSTSSSASNAGSASSAPAPSKSGGFESMKGSLPRPVAGSFKVTSRFGKHSLPDLPDVTYDNPGIDAEVSAGAAAQAVYGGKVSGVYMIPGYSTVVIVSHGGYYTVYGNIASASVKVGDVVKQGQSLGRLAPDEENPSHSLIHFEVWKNRDKMDPLGWIR
jgi:septal ring factor EnvC (AmiA/AmiB activator)